MVIFKINKKMTREDYLACSKNIVQQYAWSKNRDECLVVPDYVEVYVINNEQEEYSNKSSEDLMNELLELVGDKRK